MKRLALAVALWLSATIGAFAQCAFTSPIPQNTVIGRLGINPGPCQAIPFATLSSRLTGAAITLNSGNGQTAPGAMSGGNTYSFGATTDTPRFAGIGLGGAAPATGLEVYNATASPTANGQGLVGSTSVNGGVFAGQGSVFDAVIANKSAAVALGVTTGTQNVVLQGTLTAASLSTAGTIAGSLCMTSGGLVLYEAAINCFAVSGITVVSGKTLTIDNTIELAGTDGTKFTFPSASDTVDTLAANQTISGNKTFSGTLNITGTGQINGTAFGTFATQNFATPPAIGGTTPNTGAFSTLTATTPIGLTSGGTNASTAAGARASGGLNVDSFTPKGDTNYTILATDRVVGTSSSLTAPRTWTLPAASTVNPGQILLIADYAGGVTNANALTITRAGSDTVNGATSVTINVTNGAYELVADGVSRWTAQALGAAATVGVASMNGQTGNVSIVAGTGISVNTSGGNISVTNSGVTSLNTQTGAFTLSNGIKNVTNDIQADPVFHRSYLAGLTLSAAGSTATFGVAAGVAVDSTNAGFMSLASGYTKTTSAWAVGTGNGALDTGSISASTWYWVFLIKRTDTGVVDVLITKAVAATTPVPTLPASYTLYRYIGSIKTDGSSNWTAFSQNGDQFLWLATPQDVTNAAIGTTALTPTLTVPLGVKVDVLVRFGLFNSGAIVSGLVNSPDENSAAVGTNRSIETPGANLAYFATLAPIRTNTSAQIRAVADTAASAYYVNTYGWIDRRGRDN